MKYLHLIWRNIMRRKLRSVFTVLSILVAFLLFSYLSAINLAFSMGVDVAGEDRLLAIHKTALIMPLPISYEPRIEAIPGVLDAVHATWFGGKYLDEENRFPIFPVDPEEFMAMYPEYLLPDAQLRSWIANRTGVVVGRTTADRYGFEIGDRVPIQGTIYTREDGSDNWEFTIEGIYDGARSGVDLTMFLFQYEYFNEARNTEKDLIGWYTIRVEDPTQSAEVAAAIDDRFANSAYETQTMAEKAFVQNFAKQIGNVGLILRAVLTAVFFTILLVTGNTMAQSVRERINELAVLKTLGFSDGKLLLLVLAESTVLAGLGGGLGLGLGWLMVQAGDPTQGRLAIFEFPARDLLLGVALVLLLGVASGLLPALQAMRLRIVEGLRRV